MIAHVCVKKATEASQVHHNDAGGLREFALCFKDRKDTIVAQTLASHNLPTNRARELIKPFTDSASLRLEIEKKNSAWILGCLCVTSQ